MFSNMRKTIKSISQPLLILFAVSGSFAGMSGYTRQEITPDPINSRIYIGINKTSKAMMSKTDKVEFEFINYMIYDTKSKKKSLIFPESNTRPILDVIFELKYDTIGQKLVFNNDRMYDYYKWAPDYIVNNNNISKRDPIDKLLFVLSKEGSTSECPELWCSNKDGTNLKKIADISNNGNWHLDPLNRKIRIIIQKGKDTEINEIDW